VDELRTPGTDTQVMGRTSKTETEQVSDFSTFLDTLKVGRLIQPFQKHAILEMLSCIDGVGWKLTLPEQPSFPVNLRSQMNAVHSDRLNTGMSMERRPKPGFDDGKESLPLRFRLDEGSDHFLAVSVCGIARAFRVRFFKA
jgi:hypothetical protein